MNIRHPDFASLLLRIGFGSFMAFSHGYIKIIKLISGGEVSFPSLFGMPAVMGLV